MINIVRYIKLIAIRTNNIHIVSPTNCIMPNFNLKVNFWEQSWRCSYCSAVFCLRNFLFLTIQNDAQKRKVLFENVSWADVGWVKIGVMSAGYGHSIVLCGVYIHTWNSTTEQNQFFVLCNRFRSLQMKTCLKMYFSILLSLFCAVVIFLSPQKEICSYYWGGLPDVCSRSAGASQVAESVTVLAAMLHFYKWSQIPRLLIFKDCIYLNYIHDLCPS